jgi:hypothetical protein
MVIAQTFAGRAKIGAEPGIRPDGGTIRMKGIDIRADSSGLVLPGIAGNAIKDRIQSMIPQQPLILQQNLHGCSALFTEWQSPQGGFIQGIDAIPHLQVLDDLRKIPRQIALPAQGIHSIGKFRPDQFIKAPHHFDAGIVRREGQIIHPRG